MPRPVTSRIRRWRWVLVALMAAALFTAGRLWERHRRDLLITTDLDPEVARAARKHRLDPWLVAAVVEVESKGDARAQSRAGARGLMQLMPATAIALAREEQLALELDDLFEPAVNLDLGARYLARMIARYDGDLDLALAAYNAGPGNVARWQRASRPERAGDVVLRRCDLPETRNYVRKVRTLHRDLAARHESGSDWPLWRLGR